MTCNALGNELRILSWNCAGNIASKVAVVAEPTPDIVVLSEAEESAADHLGDAVTGSAWRGRLGNRGVAVIALNGWTVEPSTIAVPEDLFLPVNLQKDDVRIQLVGACVQKTTDYVTPTKSALERLSGYITDAPTIITGDFNQSVIFDKRRGSARHFSGVVDRLGELGMRSAWHSFSGEAMGAETVPTLYWRWSDQPHSRFHIDYTFLSDAFDIVSVTLGSFQDYPARKISDHVPLLIEARLHAARE